MPVLGKTKSQVVSEFRSSEILDAARRVFAAQGYNDSTVDDIAASAGIAKGTVYLYFNSKREIFVEALRRGFLELHAETSRRMEQAATTARKIRAFIGVRMDFADSHRDFWRMYYGEYSNLPTAPSRVAPEFQDLYDSQAELLRTALTHGMRQGEIRKTDAAAVAHVIYDTTRAAVSRRIQGLSQRSAREDETFLFDFICRGIQCDSRS